MSKQRKVVIRKKDPIVKEEKLDDSDLLLMDEPIPFALAPVPTPVVPTVDECIARIRDLEARCNQLELRLNSLSTQMLGLRQTQQNLAERVVARHTGSVRTSAW